MHICFLTNEYPKDGFPHGGIGSFVQTIAKTLVQSGVQVSVIGLNYDHTYETTVSEGIKIIRLPKSKVKGLAWHFNSRAIANTITALDRQVPIDIIEGPELAFAFLPKIKGIKYVIRLHGGHHFFAEAEERGVNPWKGFQEKRSFKKADAFIAVSKYVKTHTEKYLSFNYKPLAYINYTIDTELFRPIEGREVARRIVFAGTVCEKKGIRQLIQAFPLIKKQFPKVTLEIYGRDWFFPDGSSYMQMLKDKELPKLGIMADDLYFNGAIPFTEIPLKYAQAEVCVFPSHMETLGLVAPEAMAMQKPVVFTNKGPGPEIISHGKTGLLCNPHSPEDIAAKIIWMLEHKQQAQQMGREARKDILERFDLAVLVQENIRFYKQISNS